MENELDGFLTKLESFLIELEYEIQEEKEKA